MSFPHWLSARLKNPERVSLQEAYLAGQAYERRTWTGVFGHLGTPDEVGNEWHALSERLEAAESDGLEQARLLGMSGEREATLIAKLEAAEKERDALRATVERMDAALESLLIRCDDSDSAMYGTLSTSFVRDTVRIARDALEESK